MDGIPLNDVEVRVIGALIEKEITTPEYYPLSLNALTNACNQINNRDPVLTLGEPAVLRAVEALRDKRLAYVFSGAVNRVVKYGQKATEVLQLSQEETAVMCVLMLRGPQTVGELRGRTARMHDFPSLDLVQSVLQALSTRAEPLVVCLPRQAGSKEPRYAHLLGGPVTVENNATANPAKVAAKIEPDGAEALAAEVAELRRELAELREQFAVFRRQFE